MGTSYVVISWRPWTGQAGEGDGPVAGYNVKIKDGATWTKLGTLAPFGVDLEFNVTGLQPTSPSELMVTVNYIDGREGPPGQILSVFSEPNGKLCFLTGYSTYVTTCDFRVMH